MQILSHLGTGKQTPGTHSLSLKDARSQQVPTSPSLVRETGRPLTLIFILSPHRLSETSGANSETDYLPQGHAALKERLGTQRGLTGGGGREGPPHVLGAGKLAKGCALSTLPYWFPLKLCGILSLGSSELPPCPLGGQESGFRGCDHHLHHAQQHQSS